MTAIGLVLLSLAIFGLSTDEPGYTMSRSRRRQLMRERLDANPALRGKR